MEMCYALIVVVETQQYAFVKLIACALKRYILLYVDYTTNRTLKNARFILLPVIHVVLSLGKFLGSVPMLGPPWKCKLEPRAPIRAPLNISVSEGLLQTPNDQCPESGLHLPLSDFRGGTSRPGFPIRDSEFSSRHLPVIRLVFAWRPPPPPPQTE